MDTIPPSAPISLFDGRACTVCGQWKPWAQMAKVNTYRCRECKRRLDREHYQKNAEKIKAQVMAYHWANRDKIIARGRSEERKARNREFERTEKRKAERRAYYASEAGQAMMKAAQRRYYQSEHGKLMARLHQHRRRASGILTAEEWFAILEAYCYSCAYCGRDDCPMHIEHVIPVAKGGQTTRENIVPACKPCNSRKCDNIRTPRPIAAKET